MNKKRNYRILLLADINSAHTQKWALSLAAIGIEIGLFSLHKCTTEWMTDNPNIHILYSPLNESGSSQVSKAQYAFILPDLKEKIKDFKPDIVHAHYASSYGLLGALSGFHPFILSVWGSDVYDFPRSGFLQKHIFRYNLRKADRICSTSNTMKGEIQKYTSKEIIVTPFGIDLNVFKPFYAHHVFPDNSIVIGTVKSLEQKYGIEYLIDAFVLLQKMAKGYPIKLLIVGKGSLDLELKTKVKDLRIESETVFTGYIPPAEIPFYHNMLTISVFPSLSESESFGVSVVEAMACEKPVVVSNIGGLPEVVDDGVTGFIVPPGNAKKLAEAIEKLVKDGQLRISLGKSGRERVQKLYDWEKNLFTIVNLYDEVITKK